MSPERAWRLRISAATLTALLVLACSPAADDADSAREAVTVALARRDRASALEAIAELRARLPDEATSQLEVAQLLVQAGSAPDAGWLLEEAVRRFPERDDLRVALAKVALLLGNPSLARAVLLQIAPGGEAHGAALILLAQASLGLGELEAALETLAEAERRYPDRPEARLVRISALLGDGRQHEALAALEAARSATTGEDEQQKALRRRLDIALAQIRAQQGELDESIRALEQMVRADATNLLAWHALIQILRQDERAEDALVLIDDALRSDPAPIELYPLAAQLHSGLGRDDAALEALRRFVEHSESAAAYLPLVEFHSARDDALATVATLQEAIARFPANPTLAFLHTEALLARGRVADAGSELQRLQEISFESDPQIDYLRARIALAEGDAEGAAQRLTQLAPRLDRASTQFWLGRALEQAGDREGALRRYGLAQQRDPRWPAPTSALVHIAQRRGDWPATARHALALVRIAPQRFEGWVALVAALENLGDGEGALQVAQRCLARFPDRPKAQVLLARALRSAGRHDEALTALAKAESFDPSLDTAAERVLTLGIAGRVRQGIVLAREELASDPESAPLHAALASLLFATGDAEEGARATERALALDPGEPRPLRVRCEFRAATQRWRGALDDCARYLEARPDDPAAHFLQAAALQSLGDSEAAIAAYRRAAQLDERDLRSRNNLALLLAATGDLDGALSAAQQAYRLDEDNPHVKDTLAALYRQRSSAVAAEAASAPTRDEPTEVEANSALPEVLERLAALRRPNLVLIVVDTLRADFTTPYGFEQDTTPELAQWAAGGVVFERVRSQSSWTKISMASLLTSLWPRSHAIRNARDGLGANATTLAEVLRDQGYATYAVQTNGWLHQSFGFHQGFDRYMFPKGGMNPRLEKSSLWPHADRVHQEAVRLLDNHDRSRPFFLYLHFMDVHEYAAPPSFKTFGTDTRGAYLAAIRWVDDTVARVRKKLEASGYLDETVLILAADHGETFGEHGVHGHARNVLTPVVSVPLVMRFPFSIDPVRVATQVANLDLAPTLLALAGAPIPPSFEGRSLLPLLRRESLESDRPSVAQLGIPLFPGASVQAAITDGTWTYARNAAAAEDDEERRPRAAAPGAEFLFDRRVDPGENVNLVEIDPVQARRMRDLLDSHLAMKSAGVVKQGVRIDPAIADRLRAMGYLQ